MVRQRIRFFVGGDLVVYEFVEIFYQHFFDQLWISDDEDWAVKDVDSAERSFEVVVRYISRIR